MSKPMKRQDTVDEKEEVNLKGTLFSVSILGLFIIISWIGVWALYVVR